MFLSLCVNGLREDSLLFVQMVQLLLQSFLLSMIFLRLLYANAVVLCYLIQFFKAHFQFFKLCKLLVSKFFRLLIIFIQFLKLFSEVSKSSRSFRNLLHHVWLVFSNYMIKFLLTFQLVYFELPFKFILLFYLFLGNPQVTFKIDQKVRLLNNLEAFF